MSDINAATKPNADLIAQLKQTLALAEAGSVTNGVIVAVGEKVYHRTFSVPKPEDMPMMVGEVGIFLTEMSLIVMSGRTQQRDDRASGIVGGAASRFRG